MQQLHRWLTLEGSTPLLGGTGFFVPLGFIYYFLFWGAVLFTPYMLWKLYMVKKFKWMIGFAVTVGVPFVISKLMIPEGISWYLISALPLIFFYIYTWLLRYYVGEWIEEARWKREEQIRQRYSSRY